MGLATHDQPGDKVFRVTATATSFEASMVVELGTQAEVAGRFPKSYQVHPNTLSRETYRSLTEVPAGLTIDQTISHSAYGHETLGYVQARAGLAANGVNGGKNEAGIKRVRSFLRKAEALGYRVEWTEPGQSFGVRALRYGGGCWTVSDEYLTKAQTLALLA